MVKSANRTISIEEIGQKISQEKKAISEMGFLFRHVRSSRTSSEREMALSQINSLTNSLRRIGPEVILGAEDVSMTNQLVQKQPEQIQQPQVSVQKFPSLPSPEPIIQPPPVNRIQPVPVDRISFKLDDIEKLSLKRVKNIEKKAGKKKERKPSLYMKISSNWFYNTSASFIKKGVFDRLRRDLIRSNMEIVPATYISAVFFSTLVAAVAAFFIFLFFLFFSLSASPPFILFAEESILTRLVKVLWILVALPAVTFIFGYLYPSMERKSLERRINHELPFATIHMSAISSSMIEPSKLFGIIISTGEYPRIEKELIKLQNEINIYGYDLVTALRNRAYNSPSKKLAELFNGLATTITSGGNLPVFFEKRSQSLLFDYRLDMEKQGKAAETFMDIYISVVIASPMVLMLLLMMMRISGLGLALSPGMITFVIISVVTVINIIFLAFLQLRQTDK